MKKASLMARLREDYSKINKVVDVSETVTVLNRGHEYYHGKWFYFNLKFSDIDWETSIPAGYDEDELSWFILERVLHPSNHVGTSTDALGIRDTYEQNSWQYEDNYTLKASDELVFIVWHRDHPNVDKNLK